MDIIFDLDGTLCNIQHRLHFIRSKPKNWKAFFKGCSSDAPVWPLVKIAGSLKAQGHTIIIVSGRSDEVMPETKQWLYEYGVPYDALYMRYKGNCEPDDELKRKILNEIRIDGYNPEIVFDDRQRVVDMWRKQGLICCQVARGDF